MERPRPRIQGAVPVVDEPVDEPVDDDPVASQQAVEIEQFAQPVIGSGAGAFGVSGYGDDSDISGQPVVIVYPPPFREFTATDARSVMLTLLPHHYNLIPNPAFRTNGAGWVATGIEPNAAAFSWRVANTSATAGLNAITGNTASAVVDPDPAVAIDYVDGQLVKVVDTLASNVTVGWLKIDDLATLTVAQAAAAGITISSNVAKYRVYDPFTDSMDAVDSWVGRSLVTNGTGMLRYRAGTDKFVYTGPLAGTQGNQWDDRRGGSEYTFSVYVKGEGEVRLTMDAYNPIDRTDLTSGPEYQNLISVATPSTYVPGPPAVIETGTGRVWTAITDPAVPSVAPFYEDIDRGPAIASAVGEWTAVDNDKGPDLTPNDRDWHRHVLKTKARRYENEGRISFEGARWVDVKIEIRSANNLQISAVMLDTNEYPECAYFDGGMTENLFLDDFIWEGAANASPSYYYYDRVVRTKWLWERLAYVVPAGRPYQVFFGSTGDRTTGRPARPFSWSLSDAGRRSDHRCRRRVHRLVRGAVVGRRAATGRGVPARIRRRSDHLRLLRVACRGPSPCLLLCRPDHDSGRGAARDSAVAGGRLTPPVDRWILSGAVGYAWLSKLTYA